MLQVSHSVSAGTWDPGAEDSYSSSEEDMIPEDLR